MRVTRLGRMLLACACRHCLISRARQDSKHGNVKAVNREVVVGRRLLMLWSIRRSPNVEEYWKLFRVWSKMGSPDAMQGRRDGRGCIITLGEKEKGGAGRKDMERPQ